MLQGKTNTLIVGCGGIGTIAALNLEKGGRATVTAVLRSNYKLVNDRGFNIQSCDFGEVFGFKPTTIRNTIPNVTEERLDPFKYIIVTTKNIPDIPPSLVDLVKPAVTPGQTTIVLMQNGLNIERPFVKAFPENVILSSVTFCGSHEVATGDIHHNDHDRSAVGAFRNPNLDQAAEDKEAQEFCDIYNASGKTTTEFQPNVAFSRWRKLLYNACLNSICAVTDLDTGRIQLADAAVEYLVRPAMEEIRAAAKAHDVDLPADLVDFMITMDDITMYNPPSMQVDMRKGNFTEFENIVGEPVRDGTAEGVPMPTLTVIYGILKSMQWRTKEKKGMVEIPAPVDHTVAK